MLWLDTAHSALCHYHCSHTLSAAIARCMPRRRCSQTLLHPVFDRMPFLLYFVVSFASICRIVFIELIISRVQKAYAYSNLGNRRERQERKLWLCCLLFPLPLPHTTMSAAIVRGVVHRVCYFFIYTPIVRSSAHLPRFRVSHSLGLHCVLLVQILFV